MEINKKERERKRGREEWRRDRERGKDWEREGGRGWEGRVREGGREPLIAQLRILFGDKRRREEKKELQKLLDWWIGGRNIFSKFI